MAEIDETIVGDDAELQEIDWVSIEAARSLDLPTITLTVLDEIIARLDEDPGLSPATPVPFYRWRGSAFTRTLL